MNIKLVIFSGIITALLGSVLGLAAAHIGQKDFNQPRYESQFYSDLHYKYYGIIGAGLGFAIGVSQECVRELKAKRDKELEQ
ncbi:hypothetical protein NIES593_16475 [Hydrococcus rivularis NIES-593]|uniref:Uncharacterized protein n=1 Tax=Hydrococcus rivularis NIES-593 TaxID=1921803 RepID=A0A1U7HCA7_9CYAN|nr:MULTISPECIES: hypothetical protein [Pleurocapsales]AFY78860.1 hypothetical protein Ple7327_3667 [Pleurocapsa sp. PCC 7327]OKH21210.1 hypothetical protein NIES593_16475 [Hydrococcus rivularis NIES-593]